MSQLTPDNYEKAKGESGALTYPIWLVVNPKYPAVVNKIWLPVLAEIQDKVYRELRKGIDSSDVFIKFAVKDPKYVPNTLNWWDKEAMDEIEEFRQLALEYRPKIIISFGSFPYEFVRRAFKVRPEKGPKYWSNDHLSDEFLKAVEEFDSGKTNRIPLLRLIPFSGKFIEGSIYGENYFGYVGQKIADTIIRNKDSFNIWID